MTTEIQEVLESRGQHYGSYAGNSVRALRMLNELGVVGRMLDYPQQVYAIFMIVVKLSRLAHQLDHEDSWRDIEGYARLARCGDGVT